MRGLFRVVCGLIWIAGGIVSAAEMPRLEGLGIDREAGTSAAVIVHRCTLAHTAQIYPVTAEGQPVKGDAAAQAAGLFDQLERLLHLVDTDLNSVVRLNVYLTSDAVAPALRAELRQRFGKRKTPPAVTIAVTPAARPGVLLSLDAVAATPRHVTQVEHYSPVHHDGNKNFAHVTLLPPGRVVYVSGQAEPGKTMAEATRKTLAGLRRTLQTLQLDRSEIVQVKSFVQPLKDWDQVDAEVIKFFAPAKVPACTTIEWQGPTPSIETELVVWAPPGTARGPESAGSARYEWLAWLPVSPNYCRMTIVDQTRAIYFGGLHGRTTQSPADEVRDIFKQLEELLKAAGSDYNHLAKATYYPVSSATSDKLNTIRPEFYNPKRPPAASKAPVPGIGRPDRNITLDMIAVTPVK